MSFQLSFFRFSAWEYNEERGQFYLHQFVEKQPDFDYRNPLVIQEMQDIYTYWMDLGVDGFRVDAVRIHWPVHVHMDKVSFYLSKVLYAVEDEQLRDEPLSGTTEDLDDYTSLDHIYTYDQPETRDVLAAFHQTIKEYSAANGYDR